MAHINPYFSELKREYIFPIIEQKLGDLKKELPSAQIINFGIGDIALPLAPSIAQAICDATLEMTQENGLHGYGPHNGYAFLREAICTNEYSHLGIDSEEIFVSEGTGGDAVNLLELFATGNCVGIMDPTYPAYKDASILQGQKKIISLPCLIENDFAPVPPEEHCDVLFLCSPNNPTGMAMNRSQLQAWVNYALENEAVIILDNAYEAFVRSADVPRSIFEIPGARECAIELRSFSKTAGFTGLRCAYAVLPKELKSLHSLWHRRQATKFNGVAYPIQRGAEAVYSDKGREETRAQVNYYLAQAKQLREGMHQLGFMCYGGQDSPYVWVKTPKNLSSWEFFDLLLKKCHLICIPGSAFGSCGEGFVRFSAFTTKTKTELALKGLAKLVTYY